MANETNHFDHQPAAEQEWFCYRYLDLPTVPEHIVDSALQFAHDSARCSPNKSIMFERAYQKDKSLWFRLLDVFGKQQSTVSVLRFDFDAEFVDWVKSNIVPECLDASLACSLSNSSEDSVMGMHTDTTRDWMLMYLIETTNSDQKNIWWQQRGQPVVRQNDLQINHFNDVDPIVETVIQPHRWVLFNPMILHSVHNIQGHRVAFHISLTNQQAEKFLK